GLAARLDRAGPRVRAAHERNRSGGIAALRQLLLRGADLREIDARSRSAPEDHPFLGVPVEDRPHVVLDGQDEARRALRALLEADVEPDRRVECRLLVYEYVGQLGLERIGVLSRGEVVPVAAPARDRAGDAADHLLYRALALRCPELPAEVLLGDDI